MNRSKGSTGKNNADLASQDFYKFYTAAVKKPIPYSILKDLYKELFKELSTLIINGEEIEIPNIGFFSVRSFMPTRFKEDKFVKPPVDFKRSWEYWRKIYPGKTDEEIKLIKNKPVLRYENRHSKGLAFRFYWNTRKLAIIGKNVYNFKATTGNKRALAEVIKTNPDVIFKSTLDD
jgi:hypothetical protein